MTLPQASPTSFGEVRWLCEIDSTNRYLLDEAHAGAVTGLVVVAEHQTAGRGRLGRTWVAPPGASLLVSVLLRPTVPLDRRHLLVIAAGLSMAEAVEMETGVAAGLKWPNDLVVGERKLAGILAEAANGVLVVGVGVNLDWQEVPAALSATATACNLEGGRPTTREAVLRAFLARYSDRLTDLDRARREYGARLVTIGRRVRVEQSDCVLTGVASGVDGAGHLVLACDDGRSVTLAAGDVIHLRTE